MFCVKCGIKMNPEDRFCSNCGHEFSKDNTQLHSEETFNQPHNSTRIEKESNLQPRINPKFIPWAIILLVAYYVVIVMFAPKYGPGSPYLLLITAFLLDALVIYQLYQHDTQEVFILIAFCTFVAVFFHGISIENIEEALFFTMMTTFINLITSYIALLAVRMYRNKNQLPVNK